MPVADQMRAQQAALRFINTRPTECDVLAVMAYSSTFKVLQDFTGDRDVLVAAVKGMSIGETGMENGSTGGEAEADIGAAFTADDSEFNIFNTDRKLAALQSAVRMVGSLAENSFLTATWPSYARR